MRTLNLNAVMLRGTYLKVIMDPYRYGPVEDNVHLISCRINMLKSGYAVLR